MQSGNATTTFDRALGPDEAKQDPVKSVRVWDPFVRLFHWSLATLFLANFIEISKAGKPVHQLIGYGAVALVTGRIAWGLIGPGHARFASFVRKPQDVIAYLKSMISHRDRRHLGHNPAGGAMVVALLGGILLVGLTGWMQTSDLFFGAEWVEVAHAILVNLLFAMVVLHVLGVLHASWRHRENLVGAMFTGRKRALDAGTNATADRRG
jgi:cytochrome b